MNTRKIWTKEEDALLKKIYPHKRKKEILAVIDEPWSTIRRRAYRLNLKRDKDKVIADSQDKSIRHDAWQPEEIELLKKIYCHNTKEKIMTHFDKTWVSIRDKAKKIGLRRDKNLINNDRKKRGPRKDAWTKDEIDLLKEVYENNKKPYILSKLNRPWQSIMIKARQNGLKRNPEIVKQEMIDGGKNAPKAENAWTKEEVQLLKEIYPIYSKKEIKDQIKRTWSSIRGKAFILGLRRDPDIIKKDNVEGTFNAVRKKYGVDYTTQLPQMKEKSKQTNLKKRGVEYPTQCDEVKEKIRKTVKMKYGTDNVFQNEQIKKKSKETMINIYGDYSPLRIPVLRKKIQNTLLARYGVKNIFELPNFIKEKFYLKYGVYNPLHVDKFIQKKKDTCLKKYGFEFATQNRKVREKLSIIGRSPEVKEKKYRTMLKKGSFHISDSEKNFYKYLQVVDKDTRFQELHPINCSLIDFYMPKYDMWVQYDGIYWHGKKFLKDIESAPKRIKKIMNRDLEQNKRIPNLVRFWEDEVNTSIAEKNINNFIKKRIEEKIKNMPTLKICHLLKKKIKYYTSEISILPFNPLNIRASDFTLSKEDMNQELSDFIKKYSYTRDTGKDLKWCFTARYKGYLGSVVIINDNSFNLNILKDNNISREALIQKGASSSWSPKNLGSMLLMFSCKWMIKNTKKRVFIGYINNDLYENGTIYKACNFLKIKNNEYMRNSIFIKIIANNKKELKKLKALESFDTVRELKNKNKESSMNINDIQRKRGSRISRVNDKKIKYIIENYENSTRKQLAESLEETERWVKRQVNILIKEDKIKRKR